MIELVLAFVLAFATSLCLTPLVRKLATRYGFVDYPDGQRKSHDRPIALGGGAVVLAATLAAVGLAFLLAFISGEQLVESRDVGPFIGLVCCALLIVLLGLVDDVIGMRGRYKLVGQLFIAIVMVYSGMEIRSVAIFTGPPSKDRGVASGQAENAAGTPQLAPATAVAGDQDAVAVENTPLASADAPRSDAITRDASAETDALNKPAGKTRTKAGLALGLLAVPFTVFWFVGVMNAINLIDGIDGLASSVGLVLCLTIAAITFGKGFTAETIIMLALAGALLGFLRYNFAPASIYLGDAGSMLIGLVIGTIAIHASLKSAATVALAVPAAVWCIPILDSLAAVLRRKLTGRSFFAADRGHLHHSLLVRGWSVRQAVLFIGLICATTCLSAVLSIHFGNEAIALITVFAVVAFLVVTQTFGHIEFALLKDRFRFSVLPFSGNSAAGTSRGRESRIQLQGARQWDKLWTALVESADNYRLVKLKLIIHIPSLSEDYFASWEQSRNRRLNTERVWQVVHALIVNDEIVGRLEVSGLPEQGTALGHILQVMDFLEPIEEDVQHIMEQLQRDQPVRLGQAGRAARETVADRVRFDAKSGRVAVAAPVTAGTSEAAGTANATAAAGGVDRGVDPDEVTTPGKLAANS